MPLLLGNATKVSKYLINHDKEYDVVLQLGEKTTTADVEGEILESQVVGDEILDELNINNVLNSFVGKQQQVPPIYSAIKLHGKKLYEYARNGETVNIAPRDIEIYKINLIKIDKTNKQIYFNVRCSKGTYIRSLCEDIATKLGTVGLMKELNRVKVGNFDIKNSITIDEFEKQVNERNFSSIIKIEDIFKNCIQIELNSNNIFKYLNGVKLETQHLKILNNHIILNDEKETVSKVYLNEKFIGLGIIKNQKLKRDLVLNINQNNIIY